MTTFNEGRRPGEFIMTEASGSRSREAVTIAPSQAIAANSVLAKRLVLANVTATASLGAENVGDATIAMSDPAVTATVIPGHYHGVATDATHVQWEDSTGSYVGESIHGEPFVGEISFTITAGSTPTEENDEFYVDVTAGAGAYQHVAYDPESDDPIAGIAIYPATTGAGQTTKIAAIVRDAEANGNCIAWPDGITNAQKADAEQALAALDIIIR